MEFIDKLFFLLQIRHDGKLQLQIELPEESSYA